MAPVRFALLVLLAVPAAVADVQPPEPLVADTLWTTIASDADFERIVLGDHSCWAVAFVSRSKPGAEFDLVSDSLQHAALALRGDVAFAHVDVDDAKAIASEFSVRKRLAPRLLLFNSRARQAAVVKLLQGKGTSKADKEDFRAKLANTLADNPRDAAGRCEKLTLAIGGAERTEL